MKAREMKMKLTAKLFGMAAVMLFAASSAHAAGITAGAGSWTGSGAVFGKDGKETGQFEIALTNTTTAEHTVVSEGTITLPDGTTKTFWQRMVETPGTNHFTIETADGKGGGLCFGEGLCQAYVGTEAAGVAVSIVLDGENDMRILATSLKAGKVELFVREKLTRE